MNSENFDYKILLSVDKFDKNMWDILKYYEYIIHNILHIYICKIKRLLRSICGQQNQSAQTTLRVVSVAYRLWLPFFISRVLNQQS